MLSWKYPLLSSSALKKSYLHPNTRVNSRPSLSYGERGKMDTYEASWLAFIRTARKTFGPTPRASDDTPSSRTIFNGGKAHTRQL